MSRELDVRVAKALGWREIPGPETDYDGPVDAVSVLVPQTISDERAYIMMPERGVVPAWWLCRYWSTDIAAAWELDGEGWMWEFDEVEDAVNVDGLDVMAWNGKKWSQIHVVWAEFRSKAEAYATGRCLVWLKAKEAE